MSAKSRCNCITSRIISNISQIIFRYTNFCNQCLISRNIVSFRASNYHFFAIFHRIDHIRKCVIFCTGAFEQKLFIHCHNSQDSEIRGTVFRIFHHRHQVTTVKRQQLIIRIFLHHCHFITADFSCTVCFISNHNRLVINHSIGCHDVANHTGENIRPASRR